ncbi:MAG TPA: YicC family protein [Candidatus Copromonas faecavium]|uniref:YicC family protein n=1 Tax=Candidatus Copromonas faecavium (nom. illeg.) TaxID=2840740 RepID=A0A9D1A5C7_9FIRM|nr:YicC family protein [Candidatus Copromonas faecavium]
MINSMTGFGRYESITDECRISVEIKAVNHRYLDLGIKMPKKFNGFEAAMRTLLKNYIQRGKVDVFITYEDYTEEHVSLRYNAALAGEYAEYFRKMAEQFGIENDLSTSVLARCPEVLTMEQAPEDEEHMWELLEDALKKAAENFVESRRREGENLKQDLLGKLDHMLELVDFIESRSPGIVEEYRRKLEEKVKELLETSAIDDSRIAAEVTIFADKICVDEETVRLRSHVEGMKKELISGGSVGRKLDFIAQEMNRESNTILSKSGDLEITDHAIVLKTEIEKIREQIQNIE